MILSTQKMITSSSDCKSKSNNNQNKLQITRRKALSMHTVSIPLFFAFDFSKPEFMKNDGRTMINSVLGAYCLPKIAAATGYTQFDDFDEEYTFIYPTSWVRRRNTLRDGIYIADFSTADKLSLEIFPASNLLETDDTSSSTLEDIISTQAFSMAVINKLLNPAKEIGGDSRIEMPPVSRIRREEKEIDSIKYIYLAFPSETITRSGYQIKRKNTAVAAVHRGQVYCLGVSARSDQYNAEKQILLDTIIESFRLI